MSPPRSVNAADISGANYNGVVANPAAADVANTSIHDIAEEAGVAQGLVHYYFKSKQKLVLAVLFEVCQKMNVYTAEGTAGALAAFENFKVLLRTQPDAHSLYI